MPSLSGPTGETEIVRDDAESERENRLVRRGLPAVLHKLRDKPCLSASINVSFTIVMEVANSISVGPRPHWPKRRVTVRVDRANTTTSHVDRSNTNNSWSVAATAVIAPSIPAPASEPKVPRGVTSREPAVLSETGVGSGRSRQVHGSRRAGSAPVLQAARATLTTARKGSRTIQALKGNGPTGGGLNQDTDARGNSDRPPPSPASFSANRRTVGAGTICRLNIQVIEI